ncbi:MAG: bifunctional riboflavin kinase/FAD synthetase [Chloroflexota bacterium]|nr:bifunctional riboflavin kinase/FAD synthetase [Chloroflexota bacterium]
MSIGDELGAFAVRGDTALTIGVFDGVHRGHTHLISQLIGEAASKGLLAGVVTFREHPAAVLSPSFQAQYLTSFEDRLDLLGQTKIDLAVPITFDRALASLAAGEFISLLQENLRMVSLVVGPDFAMGRKREGTIERLTELGEEMGFTLKVVDGLKDDKGHAVRSTTVRSALAKGDVERVAHLLGRRFTLEGPVVSGKGRGGSLGIPTANIAPPSEMATPGDGIYAAYAHLDDRKLKAAVSIGTNPTFGGLDRTIEPFILDFDGNLYGSTLRLEFVRRLRDQVKFDSVEALLEQIDRDVAQTRQILENATPC